MITIVPHAGAFKHRSALCAQIGICKGHANRIVRPMATLTSSSIDNATCGVVICPEKLGLLFVLTGNDASQTELTNSRLLNRKNEEQF